jgi:D-alanyl-lipoteichoic acid acyltransferase DltB (MBOAT superfamily)
LLRIFIVFHLVCFAWIFFRATEFSTSITIIKNIAGIFAERPSALAHGSLAAGLALLFIAHGVMSRWAIKDRLANANAFVFAGFVTAMILLLVWLTPAKSAPFIYFQF